MNLGGYIGIHSQSVCYYSIFATVNSVEVERNEIEIDTIITNERSGGARVHGIQIPPTPQVPFLLIAVHHSDSVQTFKFSKTHHNCHRLISTDQKIYI